MPEMTADERARLRKLCDAATPGPWEWTTTESMPRSELLSWVQQHFKMCNGDRVWGVGVRNHPLTVVGADLTRPLHMVQACLTGNGPNSKCNSAFIAAARNALPDCLDEIERLRKERDTYAERLAREATCYFYRDCTGGHEIPPARLDECIAAARAKIAGEST